MPNPAMFTDSRIQLHDAIQSIAVTGMALAAAQSDGSHITLDWRDDLKSFVGQWVPDIHPCYLALHPTSLTSLVLDGRQQAIAAYFASTRPLLQSIVARQAGASPVDLWPHHFDMATLITLAGEGKDAKTIGVGFSPGDRIYHQPYWYVTPWPYPDPEALPSIAIGTWHTKGWVGAILRRDGLGKSVSEFSQRTAQAFLENALSACYELMA